MENKTASQEQALTEVNQSNLLQVQPPPRITWSLERDNLIKRFKLQKPVNKLTIINVETENQLKTFRSYTRFGKSKP